LSIRLRLTIWHTVLLSLALVGFSVLVYVVLVQGLSAEMDRTLDHFSHEVHRALGPTTDVTDLRHPHIADLDSIPVNEFAAPGVYVQLLDAQGQVMAASSNLRGGRLPVDPTAIQDALAGQAAWRTLAAGEGERVRVLTTPIFVNGQAVGLVQVGQSLHNLDLTTRQAALTLLGGALVALGLAAAGGWWLARRALSPVEQIRRTAEAIESARDLGRRIDFHGPTDEVGRLAATFDHLLARLDEAFQSQKRFVADSSHELRTPLTVIQGHLDLLQREADPTDQAESLAAIRAEAARMGQIVEDLLLLARLDAPQPPGRELVDVDALLVDVYRALKVLSPDREVVLEEVEPATVRGDAAQLRRLLMNLAQNAARYTAPGDRISLACRPGPAGGVLLVVQDTGPGIAPEQQARIFERFYRAGPARSRATGTGLGLAIVQAVAAHHGGHVTLESALGYGSMFTVWLPVAG